MCLFIFLFPYPRIYILVVVIQIHAAISPQCTRRSCPEMDISEDVFYKWRDNVAIKVCRQYSITTASSSCLLLLSLPLLLLLPLLSLLLRRLLLLSLLLLLRLILPFYSYYSLIITVKSNE